MPYSYTDEDKAEALRILAETYGDITAAAIHTGIPARTLSHWRQKARHSLPPANRQNGKLPEKFPTGNNDKMANTDSNPNPNLAAEAAEEFENLRSQLMKHIFGLAASLSDDPDTAHLRAIALSRLLDRVVKLDTLIPIYQPKERQIIFKFQYPDGTSYDQSPKNDLLQSAEGDHLHVADKPDTSADEENHTNAEQKSFISFW